MFYHNWLIVPFIGLNHSHLKAARQLSLPTEKIQTTVKRRLHILIFLQSASWLPSLCNPQIQTVTQSYSEASSSYSGSSTLFRARTPKSWTCIQCRAPVPAMNPSRTTLKRSITMSPLQTFMYTPSAVLVPTWLWLLATSCPIRLD